MRHLLFDIISIQGFINGGAEFTFRVLEELLLQKDIKITGLYDSTLPFINTGIDFYQKNLDEIVDINKYQDLNQLIEEKTINVFFIGIAQRYSFYNIKNISCKTIITIHDIGDIETYDNKLSKIWKKEKHFHFRLFLNKKYRKTPFRYYHKLIDFCNKPNVEIITVSEYSKSSIQYYFPKLSTKSIEVLYPPMRRIPINQKIDNLQLNNFLKTGSCYFLLLNIHRRDKNGTLVLEVFQRFLIENPNFYLMTTGESPQVFENHINLPLLSPSDLGHAYQNAYALIFPSLQEGFGYPPLEAMNYNIPVLSSNVCSMPYILSSSVLYFSPFYKNDLYIKMKELINNYSYYKSAIQQKYQEISLKQQLDLKKLIEKIKNSSF